MKQPAKRKGKTMLSWGKGATKTKKLGNNSKRNWIIAAALTALVFGGVGTYMVTQSNAASRCVDNTYRRGSTGLCVSYIQGLHNIYNRLDGVNKFGSTKELTRNLTFGSDTETAIKNFQVWVRSQGAGYTSTNMVADGIVGPQTWKALCGLYNQPSQYGGKYSTFLTRYYNGAAYRENQSALNSLRTSAGCSSKYYY